jgi:hypothetical protein
MNQICTAVRAQTEENAFSISMISAARPKGALRFTDDEGGPAPRELHRLP